MMASVRPHLKHKTKPTMGHFEITRLAFINLDDILIICMPFALLNTTHCASTTGVKML